MPIPRKIKRNEFLKITLMGGAAIYLSGCGSKSTEASNKINTTDSAPSAVEPGKEILAQENITFQLVKKGDPDYEVLRKGFNLRVQKNPAAIAVCTTTDEVAQAVKYAIENKLPVSIKSGGHSFEGFSSNEGGLVINLSKMKSLTWQDENNITVEPGCTLSELYDAVLPKNKILPAGSCGGVGLGGLTLGGGYGFFSRKYGLTCDSLTSLTMVDGKGNIIEAQNNDELLWACKGGGNGNFGVITKLNFRVQQAPQFFQSFRFKIKINSSEQGTNILEKWFEASSDLPQYCFSAFVLNGSSLYILLTTFEGKTQEVQKVINLLSPIVSTTTEGTPTPLSRALKVFYGRSEPQYFKNSSAGYYQSFEDIRSFITEVIEKVRQSPGMIYQVNTLGGMVNDEAFAQSSCYAHRNQNYLSELQTYRNSSAQGQKMIQAFDDVQKIFFSNGISAQYRNYPNLEFPNWETAYFGNNYKKLQEIKRQFDPENIFRFEQSIRSDS